MLLYHIKAIHHRASVLFSYYMGNFCYPLGNFLSSVCIFTVIVHVVLKLYKKLQQSVLLPLIYHDIPYAPMIQLIGIQMLAIYIKVTTLLTYELANH